MHKYVEFDLIILNHKHKALTVLTIEVAIVLFNKRGKFLIPNSSAQDTSINTP